MQLVLGLLDLLLELLDVGDCLVELVGYGNELVFGNLRLLSKELKLLLGLLDLSLERYLLFLCVICVLLCRGRSVARRLLLFAKIVDGIGQNRRCHGRNKGARENAG